MGPRVLTVLAVLAGVAHAGGGRLTGKVTVTEADGKPAPAVDVIVYIVGFDEPGDPNAAPAKIAQKERKFVPDLVAITVGENVTFPNGDPFLHNVFSQSSARQSRISVSSVRSPKSSPAMSRFSRRNQQKIIRVSKRMRASESRLSASFFAPSGKQAWSRAQ